MTTSLERPVPVYPSQAVLDEMPEDARAVVTMRVTVDRDLLTSALDLAAGGNGAPDDWSVDFIRSSVETRIAMDGIYELSRDRHLIAEMVDDPTVGHYVRAEYRAIDRAYPEVQS